MKLKHSKKLKGNLNRIYDEFMLLTFKLQNDELSLLRVDVRMQ